MNKKIVVIGDVILDQYHFGQVKRLNPEAPSPLINIEHSENRLGGAANVAANISSLGGKVALIGNIGKDSSGILISNLCEKQAIQFEGIITEQPTITKTRYVETTYNQQLLRADFEEYITISKNQIKNVLDIIQKINPDVIVCSDYTKGMLNSDLIQSLCGEFSDKKILVDTKPSKFQKYSNIYAFKPNFKEFEEMVGKEIENNDQDVTKYGIELTKKHNTTIVVTRGAKGASIISPDNKVHHLHTEAQKVFDVSGAGDTFLAGMAVKLNEGLSLSDAVIYGNKASGVAVGKVGTSIVYKNEVI